MLNLAKRVNHWVWDPNEERKRLESWQQEQERLLQVQRGSGVNVHGTVNVLAESGRHRVYLMCINIYINMCVCVSYVCVLCIQYLTCTMFISRSNTRENRRS